MRQYHSHSVEQEVEWLYSFDVHANAFFCSFLLTYVLQVNNSLLLFCDRHMHLINIYDATCFCFFFLFKPSISFFRFLWDEPSYPAFFQTPFTL